MTSSPSGGIREKKIMRPFICTLVFVTLSQTALGFSSRSVSVTSLSAGESPEQDTPDGPMSGDLLEGAKLRRRCALALWLSARVQGACCEIASGGSYACGTTEDKYLISSRPHLANSNQATTLFAGFGGGSSTGKKSSTKKKQAKSKLPKLKAKTQWDRYCDLKGTDKVVVGVR